MPTPTLTTERLVLDAPVVADAPAWSAAQDDECARWFDWPCPPGIERCRSYLESLQSTPNHEHVWAIRRGGVFVGGIDLRRFDDGDGNVSYFVAPAARGHHVAREALAAVVMWGREALGLSEITTSAHADNVASRKVLEATGFVLVGQRYSPEHEHDFVDYRLGG